MTRMNAMKKTAIAIGASSRSGVWRSGSMAAAMVLPRAAANVSWDGSGAGAGGGQIPVDRVDPVGAGQPLELQLARGAEDDVGGAVGQVAERRRHQHLAPARLRGDPRGDHHVAAEEVVALADRLAGVQAHPDADRLAAVLHPGRQRALDRDRALHAVAWAREDDHEAVASRLDLEAAVQAHRVADDRVVLAPQLEPAV